MFFGFERVILSLDGAGVMTLNFADSMTSLRVEMLPECSRSMSGKQGRIILVIGPSHRPQKGIRGVLRA